MISEIRYYPVIDIDTEGYEKHPMTPTLSADTVREHHRFWLEEIIPHYFRLCAAEPQSRETVSRFRIHCPYCSGILSPISSNVDGKRYFLYACDKCTRNEKEKRK